MSFVVEQRGHAGQSPQRWTMLVGFCTAAGFMITGVQQAFKLADWAAWNIPHNSIYDREMIFGAIISYMSVTLGLFLFWDFSRRSWRTARGESNEPSSSSRLVWIAPLVSIVVVEVWFLLHLTNTHDLGWLRVYWLGLAPGILLGCLTILLLAHGAPRDSFRSGWGIVLTTFVACVLIALVLDPGDSILFAVQLFMGYAVGFTLASTVSKAARAYSDDLSPRYFAWRAAARSGQRPEVPAPKL